MFLTFGKYRGWDVSEIPLSYLAWVYENLDGKPELIEAARLEIRRRVAGYEPDTMNPERVRRIYKTLAIMHHPDHGGDVGIMTGINLFYESIKQKEDGR